MTAQDTPTQSTPPNTGSVGFQKVQNPGETRDGGMLMVEAYAVIWTILMIWLFSMWNKQRSLNERLDGLEKALDKAEARSKNQDGGSAASAGRSTPKDAA
jgi:hypothetical protein